MSDSFIDHDARMIAHEAKIMSVSAIESIKAHEERCLEENRATREELIRQRQQSNENHETTMTTLNNSIAGIHRNIESSIEPLKETLALNTTNQAKKESATYRWLAIAAGSLILSLVGYIWTFKVGI